MAKQLSIQVSASDRTAPELARVRQNLQRLGTDATAVGEKGARATRRLDTELDRVRVGMGRISRVAIAAAGAMGLAFGGAQLVGSIRRVSGELDELAKTAKTTGLATDQLSSLRYMGSLAGVEFRELAQLSITAQKNLGQFAITGAGRASQAIKFLGLEVRDADGRMRDFGAVLPDIAEAMEKIEDPSRRQFLAARLFGGDADAFLRLMAEGSDRMRGMSEEAKRLGAIFTPEQLASAEEFNDALSRVRFAWEGLIARTVVTGGPALTDLLNRLASGIAAIPEMAGTLAQNLADAIDDPAARARVNAAAATLFDGLAALVGRSSQRLVMVGMAGLIDAVGLARPMLVALAERNIMVPIFEGMLGAVELARRTMPTILGAAIGPSLDGGIAAGRAFVEGYGSSLERAFSDPEQFAAMFPIGDSDSPLLTGVLLRGLREDLAELGPVIAEGADGLVGWSEALAKTSLAGLDLTSSLRRVREAGFQQGGGPTFWEGWAQGLDEVQRRADDLGKQGEEVALGISSAIEQNVSRSLVEAARGAKSWEDAFHEAAEGILADIAAITTRMLILRAIGGVIGSIGGGGSPAPAVGPSGTAFAARGGLVDGAFGGRIQAFAAGGIVQPLAAGGVVAGRDLGRDSVLGLLRPREEVATVAAASRNPGAIAYMNRGGTVAPAGGGGGIVVNITTHVSVRGGEGGAAAGREVGRAIAATVMAELERSPAMRARLRRSM